MTILLFLLLASISITQILVGSSLFGPVRKFFILRSDESFFCSKISELINCHQCSGFWVGFFSYFLWNFLYNNWILYSSDLFIKLIIAFCIFGPVISLLSDLTYRVKSFLCEECG